MVWGLFPVDPLPVEGQSTTDASTFPNLAGEDRYYIFSKGVYKVGRKGCDIIINKDKGVSRIHAEIIIDEMICMDHVKDKSSNSSSKVRIRDCSKYGTFINKNLGMKEKVQEGPNKEIMLKNGDLISFGTGNAIYRFCFVSLVFFMFSSNPSELNQLQEKISMIGASMTRGWTLQCTHMVINDFVSINDQIIDAIVAKKALVQCSWIELIAGKTICTEIPSSLSHAPNLMLEGVSIKVTDAHSREHCLRGYTFLLESICKYKFKEQLQLLLDVGGAKVIFFETLDPDSQSLGETNDRVVCVIPTGVTSTTKSFHNFDSVPKVKEISLISAVFSGHLDPSIIVSAPVLVTSSCSTDDTVVADSDVDRETVTSVRTSAVIDITESAHNVHEGNRAIHKLESSENDCMTGKAVHTIEYLEQDNGGNADVVESIEPESQGFIPTSSAADNPERSYSTAAKSNIGHDALTRDGNYSILARKDQVHAPKSEDLNVIFSQDLIVRETNLPPFDHSSTIGMAINFKLFRKTSAPSGNSFHNLVPFSKCPYEEAEYGNEDVASSMKAEKKRKQMEAVADDLFDYEKGRKRATAGTLGGFFTRH